MRIGVCINQAWNIYNFRKGLVQALIEEGHEIVAIAPPDSHYAAKLQDWGCEFMGVPMEQKGANPLTDLKLVWALKSAYRQARLDAVLQFTIKPNIYGSIAARMLNLPVINNVTGLGTVFIRKNLTAKIAHALYKVAFQTPKKVFFQNNDDRQLFFDMKLVQKEVTQLLPGSGINLKRFVPSEAYRRNATFTYLMIARLIYDKGILEYVEASRILKRRGIDCKCLILGKIETDAGLGVDRATVEAWEKNGLIEYLGMSDDVREVIEPVDCVVLPSYREGTPRTLLESSSMGKPLVTTNVAGCKETVVHGYNGYLCEVRSGQSLADAMEKVYRLETSELEEMGRNSRQLAEDKFDEKLVIQAYIDSLNSL